MPSGRQRRPFLGSFDPVQNGNALLRDGLAQAAATRERLRDALSRMRLNRQPLTPNVGGASQVATSSSFGHIPANGDNADLKALFSTSQFDAKSGLTQVKGGARVRRSLAELAPVLDPRAWGANGNPIAASLLVQDFNGEYRPSRELDYVPLGTAWDNKLLYEYARSEVASFENILKITYFTVSPTLIHAEYHLHDCLECTFGAFSAPGGLTVNQGIVKATPSAGDPDWSDIEVTKEVQVRDLTPHDPGNPYDFGEWINSTIGAALSQWIHGTAIFSPVV